MARCHRRNFFFQLDHFLLFSVNSQNAALIHHPPHPQLESQLETQETERSQSQRSVRNVDRIVKDLQSQIERKDKQAAQLNDDATRLRDKVEKLLTTIDELQASESSNQLSARRAERELREEKEKTLRLERELEGWKHLRMEKGSVNGSIRFGTPALEGATRRMGSWRNSISNGTGVGIGLAAGANETAEETASLSGTGIEVPKRKSSIKRVPSLTKGFL
ncbi:hypothetical protein F5X96DRAFT_439105 [Biscogniauxia mediterranea]|nr:hypothetical protein F5X96DRAFT_439105 [Biscogniauxia mediterranea]